MPSVGTRARPALAALWVAGLVAAGASFHRSSPLFVNLGAGDEPFAHGFRSRWEREGRRGNPETMFRWTEDGARLVLPVGVAGRDVRARMRLARFSPEEAEIVILANGREVDRWMQASRGFHVREVAIGGGPVSLQFRSTSADGNPLGVALDWIEFRDAGALVAPPGTIGRALGLLVGIPMLGAVLMGRMLPALALGALLAWAAACGGWIDRLGTLTALAGAFVPAVLVTVVLASALRIMERWWPDAVDRRALAVPLAAAALWLGLVFHPFYYYPDVDRHRVLLHALMDNPALLADPTQPWAKQVTRDIGGRPVALPYAFVFHAAAWPLVPLLGEAEAMKTAGIAALGLTVLLVFPLARAASLGFGAAVCAQVFAAFIPVSTSRVVLALYPTLLGQAAIVLLLVHLARRLVRLDGARDAAAATIFLFLAQAAYTGSLISVGALVAVLAALEAAAGETRRALRLAGAWAVATALVLAQYAGFFPVLWNEILPHVGGRTAAADAETGNPLALAVVRLGVFFGFVFAALATAGFPALRGAIHARRVLAAAVAAGCALAVLRFVTPALLRDAKEVEMLAAPVAVASAAAIALAWERGGATRVAGALAALAAIGWGAWRSALFYADRFTAAGR